jgi:hypothetical protein
VSSSIISEKSIATGREVLVPEESSDGGSDGLLGGGSGAGAGAGRPIPIGAEDIAAELMDFELMDIELIGDEPMPGDPMDADGIDGDDIEPSAGIAAGGGGSAALGMVCDHIGGAGSGAGAASRLGTDGAAKLPGGKLPAAAAPRERLSTRAIGSQSSMPPCHTKVRLVSLPALRSANT